MSRHVGFGLETTYGSAEAPTEFTEAVSESLHQVFGSEDITTIRSPGTAQVLKTSEHWEGDIELAGNFQDIGLLLRHFFGSVDTTLAGPYQHDFPDSGGLDSRTGLSLTVEVKRDSDARNFRYAGGKVTGLRIAGSLGSSPKITASMVGKSVATDTAAVASHPTFDPMVINDFTLSFDGGSTDLDILSFDISMAYPVDRPFKIGATTFFDEPADDGPLDITGTMEACLTDSNMSDTWDIADGATAQNVELDISDGTHSMKITTATAKVFDVNAGITGRERNKITLGWRAYGTETSLVAVELVNDDALIPPDV